MTLFLHVPELEAGISQAESALGTIDEESAEQKKAQLINTLYLMLDFAQTNLNDMLHTMGFNSIEELNAALQNYNNLHLSLSQLFPAFSEPQITEVLARSGIGTQTKEADYGLVISALEDNIYRLYPEFIGQEFMGPDMQAALYNKLNDSSERDKLAASIIAQLFGGLDLTAMATINLNTGATNFMQLSTKLINAINKNAHARGAIGTQIKTIMPFYKLLQDFFGVIINTNFQNYLDDNKYLILEQALKQAIPSNFQREIISERIKRGGMTISTKNKTKTSSTNDGISIVSYIDKLQIKVNKDIFNLQARGKKSIENYVNEVCDQYPEVRAQIVENIKQFYWNVIQSYIPITAENPISYEDFGNIIDEMTSKKSGNIGWFFSQSSSKELGVGMFGEVASMIYMSVLCPKLRTGFTWAGGVTDGAKPPADVILEQAGAQYGIQVKNYTSGTTLSHDYGLTIKNIVDETAIQVSKEKIDLMTMQASYELEQFGITSEEIEAVQNIIIANTFNIPYRKQGNEFVAVSSVDGFSEARQHINAAYLQATKYMAIISLIMHRVQYYENINRKVNATSIEKQLQNTLWLINGQMFVSSVQIIQELINYIETEANKFFSISASIRISKDRAINGLKEGKMTIVEYLNYNTRGLGQTALNAVSARIGTNYKMSAFNP